MRVEGINSDEGTQQAIPDSADPPDLMQSAIAEQYYASKV